MRHIKFWADGYVSYYSWGEICSQCSGNVFPSKRPNPDPDCYTCSGMGGSPLDLCPVVRMGTDTYAQLLLMGCGRMPLTDKIKPHDLQRAIIEIESTLRDHPEAEEAAWMVTELKHMAEFATDLGTDVLCSRETI